MQLVWRIFRQLNLDFCRKDRHDWNFRNCDSFSLLADQLWTSTNQDSTDLLEHSSLRFCVCFWKYLMKSLHSADFWPKIQHFPMKYSVVPGNSSNYSFSVCMAHLNLYYLSCWKWFWNLQCVMLIFRYMTLPW